MKDSFRNPPWVLNWFAEWTTPALMALAVYLLIGTNYFVIDALIGASIFFVSLPIFRAVLAVADLYSPFRQWRQRQIEINSRPVVPAPKTSAERLVEAALAIVAVVLGAILVAYTATHPLR